MITIKKEVTTKRNKEFYCNFLINVEGCSTTMVDDSIFDKKNPMNTLVKPFGF